MNIALTLLGQLDWANVEDLPSGPLHEVWLLERPVPTAILLVVVALVAAVVMARRSVSRWPMVAAIGGVALGAGVLALGSAVETEREMLTGRTREFVERFVEADSATVRSMLSEKLVLASAGADVGYDRAWLVGVASVVDREITDVGYRSRGAVIDGPGQARTRFSVTTEHSGTYATGTIGSSWELAWRRFNEGWLIVRLECLSIRGQTPPREWVRWGDRLIR